MVKTRIQAIGAGVAEEELVVRVSANLAEKLMSKAFLRQGNVVHNY